MKRFFKLPALLAWGFWLFLTSNSKAQENLAMDFDGVEDYISLNTTATPVTGDANFTAEAWFIIASPPNPNCGTTFRRLITLSGTSRFEIGECDGQLKFYWFSVGAGGGQIPGGVQTISGVLTPDCHHIAAVRNGAAINIYLDGNLTPIYTGTLTGILNTTVFRIGHWGGGTTGGQDWLGTVDEVRLWSAPRTAMQIRDFQDCTLSGISTDLVANWTFDQGNSIIPGGNNAGSMAIDMSGNNNHGAFSTVPGGFALNGATSNFVNNTCPPRYFLDISDQIALFPVSLIQICAGDRVHFCVMDNLTGSVSAPVGTTVVWESSDGSAPWAPDQDMANYTPSFNATCFPVKKGVITNPNCGSIGQGFVDRKYRAKIIKQMGAEQCTYTTAESSLRICCPPTCGNITIVPNLQPPWCEGDNVSMTVFLQPCDPWLPFGPNVTIDWCMIDENGTTPLPQYQNQLSFGGFQIVVGIQDICLQAKISNCSCPGIIVEKCFDVDPLPVCGTIQITATPPTPITLISPGLYEICPGDYTTLEMTDPSQFHNCNPVWQYHFDFPIGDPWKDLGSSNSSQNTNTLPQTNPADPAFWPLGAKCIFYRIECRPKSWPNSGCDPCHTNEIEICLKPAPPSGTISGPTQFCKGGSTTLTITPNPVPTGPWIYCWYLNGVLEQCFNDPITTFNATKPGCYWVEIQDWCQSTKVGPYCVDECILVPIIKCPTDNPCGCDGLPITLNGCDSYSTCGNIGPLPLQYTWTASNGGPCAPGSNGPCECVHTPDPVNGTTYTLTITDPNFPNCSATSKPFYFKPCQ